MNTGKNGLKQLKTAGSCQLVSEHGAARRKDCKDKITANVNGPFQDSVSQSPCLALDDAHVPWKRLKGKSKILRDVQRSA